MTSGLLPVGTLPQLLITLLVVGIPVLALSTPGLLRQRRVRRFQERVRQRDQT
ncbi:hypothetical protein [Synechococcus sp. NOUM97013]|uniref:hypothetical protein n=1 Tax=Synechococcus sp. NOUM97013 TaxID=1442555 RepID=UPI001644C5AD|nr:hypothetical protein [Synechococcus sp. NOUM97013]